MKIERADLYVPGGIEYIIFIQMAESRKDQSAFRNDQVKKKESPAKSNPFEAFKTLPSNPTQDSKPLTSNPKQSPSSKSPSSYSHSSRSRSRDQKPAEIPSAKGATTQPQSKSGREKDISSDQLGKQPESQTEEAYFKTKMCPLYEKGACKKGTTCNFAHGERELRGLPNFRKTRLCIPFKNGECHKSSSECKYAHGEAQIRKLAYDYFPQKNQGNYRRFQKPDRSHDRAYQRGQRDDHYHRGPREQRPYRDNRDSRDRRDFQTHRDRRDYRGERDYRDRPRQREQEHRYNRDSRDNRDTRDRYKDERERYNVEYQIRGPEMYPPPPGYGYMPSYNSAYVIPPSMGGYNNPNQIYPPASGSGQPAPAGFGQSAPSSSFSGSGHNLSSNSSYGSYNYGYGFVPQSYPYNPPSV